MGFKTGYAHNRFNGLVLCEVYFKSLNSIITIKQILTKKIASLALAIVALFFYSCSSGNSVRDNSPGKDSSVVASAPAYDNSLSKGLVNDSIICRNQSGQSYALYLPSYYSSGKKFPCIYFSDAHARGGMPVRLYKDIAEKYGFVLVGSNVSKNGMSWPVSNDGIKALMEDTRARINIDPKRLYTSGFSGGSRVAASVAIFNGGVAGVIGCAAGFPQVQQMSNKFDYFGIAGDDDFNCTEMQRLDAALERNGFIHQFLAVHGKHGWATAADFETAVLWVQVNAMKENLQSKNDTLIAALKKDYDRRITVAASAHDMVSEHALLAGMVAALDGLIDIATCKKQLAGLEAGAQYKKETALQEQLQTAEVNAQQELAQQFQAQNEQWWAKKIAALNQSIHSAKTKQESHMYARVLNYLGLVSYMNTSHALQTDDLSHAATYLAIFKIADPKNPDCSYLAAEYYIKKGNAQQAVSSLNEAASLGYSDLAQLMTEPLFLPLHDDETFKKIATCVGVNTKTEK